MVKDKLAKKVEKDAQLIMKAARHCYLTSVVPDFVLRLDDYNMYYMKALCPFQLTRPIAQNVGEPDEQEYEVYQCKGKFVIAKLKDVFYCHDCKQGGDVVTFISKIKKTDQVKAAKYILKNYAQEDKIEHTKTPEDLIVEEKVNKALKDYNGK